MGENNSTEGPLVSVVVPFYNVEDYAGPCLASLVAQTFEDCEFVCVDDGSTDGTPDALARYAALDGRIRIIRIEHAGLSVARNSGVEAARAGFISFVDGDDVVSPDYVQALYGTYVSGGAGRRMAVVHARSVRPFEETVTWADPSTAGMERLERREVQRRLLLGNIGHASWARLAPRELYEEFPFMPDMLFEDRYAAPDHLSWPDETLVLQAPLYGYVAREGSITRTDHYSLQGVLDSLSGAAHMAEVSQRWDKSARQLIPWMLALRYRTLVWRSLGVHNRRICLPLRRETSTFMRENTREIVRIWRENELPTRTLVGLFAVGYFPPLCRLLRAALDVMPPKMRRTIAARLK